MIIIGYQGIGKSTLAKQNLRYIDLESSNFRYYGVRPADWYIYYCQTAEHLSQQSYIVFISSHEVVRNFLKENTSETLICIYPSIFLAEEWTEKLKQRYYQSHLEKDYRAWQNAKDKYHENISELMMCGIPHIEINSLEYNLEKLIRTADYSRFYKNNLILK